MLPRVAQAVCVLLLCVKSRAARAQTLRRTRVLTRIPLTTCPPRARAQPFPLRTYMTCLAIRGLCVNAAVFTVPWWPAHTRAMWPTLLQFAVHLALMVHAPRQSRLVRARWAAQQAEWRSREE